MGTIRREVKEKFLSKYPEEEKILNPFLNGFHITWARKRQAYNTELSVFFLSPEPFIKEGYGFESEILLVYASYNRMEPRTIQAAEYYMNCHPAKGRVETLNFFLISDCEDVRTWIDTYISSRQESRIIISFSTKELLSNNGDAWFIRNKLNEQFYGRDLFAYTLPLTEDTYFFGRQQILANYIDAIKLSENRGIFGLRKTGKTSFLFKLQRIIKNEKIGHVFFYDCKTPSLRKLRWNELLGEICSNIAKRLNIPLRRAYDEISIVKTFRYLIRQAKLNNQKIILIFDEIEYISFKSIQDNHWHNDYIDFWQTMWACQSQNKNLVFIIAGVNPSVVETDTINRIQNPLFGIVPSEFLRGFTLEEARTMIKTIGKKMGLKFDYKAIESIHNWYGGHPLLTRLACSWINKISQINKESKPIEITESRLKKEKDSRDSDLTFYCKHVVSELKDFYPDEYKMLELLSSGQTHDFVELSNQKEFVKHLTSYGLLSYDENNNPYIAIPVIGRYIGLELAKREGRQTIYKVVDKVNRTSWLEQRKESIINDFRILEKVIKMQKTPLLFGPNSFPEADEFKNVKVINSKSEFVNFINIVNRCFVESIVNYGKSINNQMYLNNVIKINYPGLFYSLERIKIYRNEYDHLLLYDPVNHKLLEYLKIDLEDRKPSNVKDLYFVLQQRILDGLLTGINIEINNLS